MGGRRGLGPNRLPLRTEVFLRGLGGHTCWVSSGVDTSDDHYPSKKRHVCWKQTTIFLPTSNDFFFNALTLFWSIHPIIQKNLHSKYTYFSMLFLDMRPSMCVEWKWIPCITPCWNRTRYGYDKGHTIREIRVTYDVWMGSYTLWKMYKIFKCTDLGTFNFLFPLLFVITWKPRFREVISRSTSFPAVIRGFPARRDYAKWCATNPALNTQESCSVGSNQVALRTRKKPAQTSWPRSGRLYLLLSGPNSSWNWARVEPNYNFCSWGGA